MSKTLAYTAAEVLSRLFDFKLYSANMPWHRSLEFREIWRNFPDKTNLIQDRRFNLYNLAKAFAHVPGDIAEAGVLGGRSAHVLLAACPGKNFHGFDSFEGVSEPTTEDKVNGEFWAKGSFQIDEEKTRENLTQHGDRVSLYRGWIPERFSEVAELRFAIVHVDVDQYQPTMHSFEFFWPRLSANGLIVCDDYGSIACPGARRAVDEFASSIAVQVCELATGQALLFKNS